MLIKQSTGTGYNFSCDYKICPKIFTEIYNYSDLEFY